MDLVPHPPYFSLFPRTKIELKGRHFYTTEVIEGESQVVLNTLTEYDRERCICTEGNCFKVFDQMAARVPEVMAVSLYFFNPRNVCEWM
jgi:hypothetical protein